ncbi:Rho guanine nucleotide exchange factor 7 [Tupaia chinensis]|uniref:Rho guanine nucleotide exchange factor 7 n=1 Tax=Tupaia chinensis TaxID=246437 RepID=L9JAV9_TUPCH|nr:Rho guanine nucleotide exchange factor 7 [Tupaia chinensis]
MRCTSVMELGGALARVAFPGLGLAATSLVSHTPTGQAVGHLGVPMYGVPCTWSRLAWYLELTGSLAAAVPDCDTPPGSPALHACPSCPAGCAPVPGSVPSTCEHVATEASPVARQDMTEHSSSQLVVRAKFNFQQTNEDELSFSKGDVIHVTRVEEGGWWEGTHNGRTGWFPSNYVREVKPSDLLVLVPGSASLIGRGTDFDSCLLGSPCRDPLPCHLPQPVRSTLPCHLVEATAHTHSAGLVLVLRAGQRVTAEQEQEQEPRAELPALLAGSGEHGGRTFTVGGGAAGASSSSSSSLRVARRSPVTSRLLLRPRVLRPGTSPQQQ